MSKYKAGVLHGAELEALYNDAKDNQFATSAEFSGGCSVFVGPTLWSGAPLWKKKQIF